MGDEIFCAQKYPKFSSQILLHQEQHQRPKRSVRSIVSHRANIFNISNAPFEVDSKQKFPHSWVRSARGLHALHKFKARGRSTSPRREREDPRECLMRSGARNGLCLLISALILGNVEGGTCPACAAGTACSSEGSTTDSCVSCPGEKRQRTKWRK